MCSNILACVIIIAGSIACVMCLIGLAVPAWYVKDSGPTTTSIQVITTTYEGLWQRCTLTEIDYDTRSCAYLWDIEADSTAYTSGKKAVLAMCIIGVAVMIGCVIVMCLHLTLCNTIDFLAKLAGILALIAGLFILIGVIVYATDVKDDAKFGGSDLHGGFGLCLAASIGCFIIGGLCFFAE